MIARHGEENSLILVGSSDTIDKRTPFSFHQRKEIIRTLYPEVNILPLPDVNPDPNAYTKDSITLWLESIEKIEEEQNAAFTFYGGSEEDLQYLGRKFQTEVLVPRFDDGLNISGSQVRAELQKIIPNLVDLLDQQVIPHVLKFHSENI